MSEQRQDSLTDQMADVLRLAAEAGCYDAHEWITLAWQRPARPLRPSDCRDPAILARVTPEAVNKWCGELRFPFWRRWPHGECAECNALRAERWLEWAESVTDTYRGLILAELLALSEGGEGEM